MKFRAIFFLVVVITLCCTVINGQSQVSEFDCSTLHPQSFNSLDGKKCYIPDLTVTSDFDTAVSYCENLDFNGFDNWMLINPRNLQEDAFLREVIPYYQTSTSEWWIGQNDKSSEKVYKNLDDPEDCPGVYLGFQVDTNQPNGNYDNQGDQDCVYFEDDLPAFQDKSCWSEARTICKTISTTSIDCSTLHASAIQNPDDTKSCYITEDAATGATDTVRTFSDAVAYCEDLTIGGVDWHVPDILDEAEVTFLGGATAALDFDGATLNFYWVGQNDIKEEQVWEYLNQPEGCPPVFVHFRPGQPNDDNGDAGDDDCLMITPFSATGAYQGLGSQDKPCSALYNTMCEMTIPVMCFAEKMYVAGEQNGNVTVRITLNNYKSGTVSVEMNVQDVSTTSSDYTLPSDLSASFTGNDDYVDKVFPINANDGSEGLESFTITLENPSRGALCENMMTTVYISDETAYFILRANLSVVFEGSKVDIEFFREGFLGNTDVITYHVFDGDATIGDDYKTPNEQSITFLPGEEKIVKTFEIISDEVDEGLENFVVSLSIDPDSTTALTAVIGTLVSAEILIRDKPAVSLYELEDDTIFGLEDMSVIEIVIKRTGDASDPGHVYLSTKAVTASPGTDFTAIENERIDFDSLQTEKTVMLDVAPDNDVEPDEILQVCLSDPGPNDDLGTTTQAIVTILDDDVEYCFADKTYVAFEGDNVVRLTVEKKGLLDKDTTTTLQTVDGTAKAGTDYEFLRTTLRFTAGMREETADVKITDDETIEPMVSFNVQLISNDIVLCSTTVWIQNDDDTCPDGYTGNQCETALSLCSVPCLNGGICSGPELCVCRQNFVGDRCETELCHNNFCLNGGSCVPDVANRQSSCSCDPNFEGEFCEIAIPEPQINEDLSDGEIIGTVLGVAAVVILSAVGIATILGLRRRQLTNRAKTAGSFAMEMQNYGYPNLNTLDLASSPYTIPRSYNSDPLMY